MPVTPSGPIAGVQETLRQTLAASAALRTWMGAASVNAALARIYHNALPAPAAGPFHTVAELQTYRPFAIVSTFDSGGWTSRAEASGTWQDRGILWAALEDDVAAGTSPGDAELAFANTIGAIVGEVQVLARASPYLTASAVDVKLFRCPPECVSDQGDHMIAVLTFEWEG